MIETACSILHIPITNTMESLDLNQFVDQLRSALRHLYDANYLRSTPLAKTFGVNDRLDTSAEVRSILVDAINSFKPKPDEPDQSRAWRIFDSLYCCYIQQLKQQIVADQLSISPRQLRREQAIAIEALADYLLKQYPSSNSPHIPAVTPPHTGKQSPLANELQWILDHQPDSPTILKDVIRDALTVTNHLAVNNEIQFKENISADLPPVAIHAVVLNQIFVNLIIAAINRTKFKGCISLNCHQTDGTVKIKIKTYSSQAEAVDRASPNTNIKIAKELTALSSIPLSIISESGRPFSAELTIPAQGKTPVLVIDDNSDTLKLFMRYAEGTRYQLITTQETEDLIAIIETLSPRIIVLDIMMPQNNGWIILGRLKQHPISSHIPVIVCTILPQEELALSLGAHMFIQKPVNRQQFIEGLNHCILFGAGDRTPETS